MKKLSQLYLVAGLALGALACSAVADGLGDALAKPFQPNPDQLADPVKPGSSPPTATITVTPIPNTINEMGVDVWLASDDTPMTQYQPPAPRAALQATPIPVGEPSAVYHPGPGNTIAGYTAPPTASTATTQVSTSSMVPRTDLAPSDFDSFMNQPVTVNLVNASVDEIMSYLVQSPWKVETDLTDDLKRKRFHIAMESRRTDAFNTLRYRMGLKIRAFPKLGLIVVTDRKDN